jgi:hypothetical protein
MGGGERFQVLGHLPDSTVAEVLNACDFAFSAYPPALLGKSTVFSAFLFAGLPVLVADPEGQWTLDPEGPPALRAETWDWSQIRSSQVELLRQSVKDYAFANLSWPVIARRALGALQAVGQLSLVSVGENASELVRIKGHY